MLCLIRKLFPAVRTGDLLVEYLGVGPQLVGLELVGAGDRLAADLARENLVGLFVGVRGHLERCFL